MEYNFTFREKDNGWQVIVSYKDSYGRWKQKSKQGFESKRDAKKGGDAILDEIKENAAVYIDNCDITFGLFAKNYISNMQVRQSTLEIYERALKLFAPICDKKLPEIKCSDIRNILYSLKLKPTTANMYFSKIKTIFKAAVDYELIGRNPATLVKRLKTEPVKVRVLTQERMEHILESLKYDQPCYVACSIAAYTGLRIGEIMGLTWDAIDLERSMIHVRQQYGCQELKTGNSYRSVPIPNKLKKILEGYHTEHFLFEEKMWAHVDYRLRAFGVSAHAFRHTYATLLLSKGFDIRTVAALLGDKVETVLGTYIHYNDDMRERAKNKLLDFF